MSKLSNRRCRCFDRNGDPLDGGCSRPASLCAFYHPEEKGWDTATSSLKTSHRGGPSSQKSHRRRDSSPLNYGPGFRRDSGYPRHRRSRSASRSRSPFRSTRHDSIASTIPERAGSPRTSKASHDPRTSSVNDVSPIILTSTAIRRPTPPQAQQEASSSSSMFNSAPSLPTPPANVLQAGNHGDVSLSSTDRPPIIIPWQPKAMGTSTLPRRPSLRKSQPAPPAQPAPPLPMPPPHSLPPVPAALSAGIAPSTTAEQTPGEKRAMWEERTRIFSESELAREQLTAIEEQLSWSLQLIESKYFNNQSEEDKTCLKAQYAELEKRRDEIKRQLDESMDKLFKTGSWPLALPAAVDDDVEERQKEVVTYIQELKDTALQMSKILGDISTFKAPPTPPLFSPDDSEGVLMDVDQPDGDNARRQSLKRRRISDNLDGRPSMPTQEELDKFLERLANMEDRVSTLQNDINQHGREAREEFEYLVDTKLDEIQAAREEAERQRLEEGERQMQDLERDITLTGDQVGELASEIGDLIIRVGKCELNVEAAKKGRQESFEKVLEVERRLQEYIARRDENVRIMQTLEQALNAYISQPPSPPATPLNMPPFDYIYESLEEPMVQSIRSHLVHVVEELRKDVENMVNTKNAELYSTLWNKITVTLNVLGMIQSRINQGDDEPVQRLAENAMKL